MQDEFLVAGFGGQGVMFAGQLLAYAAMDEGREVTWIPSYGPEMRGGTAHCFVVISDQMIGSPIVRYPQAVMAFNKPSFDKYEPIVAPHGLLVRNVSLITQASARGDVIDLAVPGTEIADELGNPRLMNMVLLGAALTVRPVVSVDSVRRMLETHLPAHRRDLLALNFQALERGAACAAKFAPVMEAG